MAFLGSAFFVLLIALAPALLNSDFTSEQKVSEPSNSTVIGSSTDSKNITIDGDNNMVTYEIKNNELSDNIRVNEESCYKDWGPINGNNWEGLSKGFESVGNVFSPPREERQVDSVAWYKIPCKGGIKADLEYVSYSENIINLNIYYGNWFRWEIGGGDLRSVRLYKNTKGCKAFQGSLMVDTHNKYLLTGEIVPKLKTTISMLVFNTKAGKLRTELHIAQNGKDPINDNERFYYEFDVGLKCNDNTLLNIDSDFERIGIGLMKSYPEGDERPRVTFESFRINEYEEGGEQND